MASLKAFAFEIGPHEGLDQPHPGDVLLQDGVEPVELLLHGPEERLHPDDEKDDERGGDQQKRQQARARRGLVLTIRMRLPIISSGARVPIRSETSTTR